MRIRTLRSGLPDALRNGKNCQNAGLALERYLARQVETGANDDRTKLLCNVADASVPGLYKMAYKRWEDAIKKLPAVKYAYFQVQDRLIIGLGSESVLETGLTLNRIYGVPVIPGSALKGLARHYYIRTVGSKGDELFKAIFGREADGSHSGSAGYITFLDGWYVPTSNEKPLRPDVITVHHPEYYTSAGNIAPTDFDDPNPVGFVSAVGKYLVAIRADFEDDSNGIRQKLLDETFKILSQALADFGIGGKTSSGYGRMKIVTSGGDVRTEPKADSVGAAGRRAESSMPAESKSRELVQRIQAIPNTQIKSRIYGFYEQWKKLPDDQGKLQVAKALHEKLSHASVRGMWGGKPLAEVTEYISQAGGTNP